jgi:hypothetical protein
MSCCAKSDDPMNSSHWAALRFRISDAVDLEGGALRSFHVMADALRAALVRIDGIRSGRSARRVSMILRVLGIYALILNVCSYNVWYGR